MVQADLQELDKTQLQLLSEQCILVNGSDEVVGHASKKQCHLWENIKGGLLHRAFSVILFNSNNELLIQQRSEAKITYPFHFTNTCCSHPLYVETELEPEDSVGIKRAAQRRLHYELGIPPEQVPLNSLMLMTRIHYLAQNYPDIRWGEHEVDYILICRADVDLDVNSNEVREIRYVSQTELKTLLAAADAEDGAIDRVTPWFKLLCTKNGGMLFKWWDNLDNLKPLRDDQVHDWTGQQSTFVNGRTWAEINEI